MENQNIRKKILHQTISVWKADFHEDYPNDEDRDQTIVEPGFQVSPIFGESVLNQKNHLFEINKI